MTDQSVCQIVSTSHAVLCASLHALCFSEGEQWSEEAFTALLSAPGVMAWVVLEENEPSGVLMIRYVADEAEILTLGVIPAHQRRNLASKLIAHACDILRDQGVHSLYLEVSTNNRAATALYVKQGFLQCGYRQAYYPDGSDACVMRYDLVNVIM
ncbi:GNAT family N-acetyltransferase [Asaia prunellae]|uniref:GNAT family N-acetyltransferase n=1 Tax=Asaia prunellae TaxID=610245 RepID=UPI000472620C|nr:GNAT family N-acetyltransferase [Asaia prunellae]